MCVLEEEKEGEGEGVSVGCARESLLGALSSSRDSEGGERGGEGERAEALFPLRARARACEGAQPLPPCPWHSPFSLDPPLLCRTLKAPDTTHLRDLGREGGTRRRRGDGSAGVGGGGEGGGGAF